ncbi:hypothetical protein HY638_03880 [Candidatus Woesearchaeota archaeon]|nr:hypothetical protein [Candidatus Woesearchaeota archaeon]
MPKIHTRVKRVFCLSTHVNQYDFFHPKGKTNRARTFSTEESAKKWASENKVADYTLEKAKKGKRFKIVS